MNERIQQLAEQAGFMEAWFSESGDDCEREIKKLAYLIIRECRDIVGKTRDQAIEEEWNVDEAMSTAMFDIEDYFGVE